MKKQGVLGYAILGILFVLVNVIVFAVPTAKTGAFWVAYVFTVIAFASQIAVWKVAFGREDTLKSKFLGIPVVHVGIVYLIIQIIALVVFMAVPTLPAWSAIIVCALILGISAICMISAETAREEIERVEARVKQKVFYIRSLQVDVEMLAEAETDEQTKKGLTQLAEKIRFSDPMSSDELAALEAKIVDKVETLKTAPDKLAAIEELNRLLTERNKKCKLLK